MIFLLNFRLLLLYWMPRSCKGYKHGLRAMLDGVYPLERGEIATLYDETRPA